MANRINIQGGIIVIVLVGIFVFAGCQPSLVTQVSTPNLPVGMMMVTPVITLAKPSAGSPLLNSDNLLETPTSVITETLDSPVIQTPVQSDTPAATLAGFTFESDDPTLSAWCLPQDASVSNAKDPLNPPTNAKPAAYVKQVLEIRNLPSSGCVFIYTFTKTAPSGLLLEVSETSSTKPFATIKLQPVDNKPEVVWALVTHSVIITPPGDSIRLSFSLKDQLGQVINANQVSLMRWLPGPTNTPEPDCGCGP